MLTGKESTLVESNICYIILQLLILSMISFRLALSTVTQSYATFQRVEFRGYR